MAVLSDPPFFNDPKPPVDRIAAMRLERLSPPAGAILLLGGVVKVAGGPPEGGGGGGGGGPVGIGEPRVIGGAGAGGGGGGGGGGPPAEIGGLMLMDGMDGDCLMPLLGTGGGGGAPCAIGFCRFNMGGIGGGAGAFVDLFLDGGGGGGGPLLPMPHVSVVSAATQPIE